ncbi:hypothetical protein C2S52_008208 [Perilla frutescens var. hirtella]|nr:hypothetical protein C2S52_008208 [Perilla frutescens var. hirtella]
MSSQTATQASPVQETPRIVHFFPRTCTGQLAPPPPVAHRHCPEPAAYQVHHAFTDRDLGG